MLVGILLPFVRLHEQNPIASLIIACLFASSPVMAQDSSAPQSPLIKQLNNGSWLPADEAQNLSNDL